MPDESTELDIGLELPFEEFAVKGLELLGGLLEDRSDAAKQYTEFWWYWSWWSVRQSALGESAAGPEPRFEDFARPRPAEEEEDS